MQLGIAKPWSGFMSVSYATILLAIFDDMDLLSVDAVRQTQTWI
jgi:hypothetical protein